MSEGSAVEHTESTKGFLLYKSILLPLFTVCRPEKAGLNNAGSCGGFGGPELSAGPISLCTHISEEILYLKTFSFIPIKENFHMP